MRKHLLLFLVLVYPFLSHSQNDTTLTDSIPITQLGDQAALNLLRLPGTDNTLPFSIPPSPEAEAFRKHGNYPVSQYTGLPNISIPIYTIHLEDLDIPIELSYHASGIKVDETASWVGLGWSLSSGGVISREIKGIADEDDGGIADPMRTDNYYPASLESISTIEDFLTGNVEIPFLKACQDGQKDTESDIYSLNAFGMNVKFIIDPDANVHCLPQSNLKIVPINASNLRLGWIVTDPNGNKFYFERTETTTSMVVEKDGSSPTNRNIGSPITGWYITKIIPSSGYGVYFNYQGNGFTQAVKLNEFATYIPLGVSSPEFPDDKTNHSFSKYEIRYSVPVLSSIQFNEGGLNFFLNSSSREDTQGTSWALNKIELRAFGGSLIKSFEMDYGYFVSSVYGGGTPNYLHKRLKLLSVTEKGSDGQALPPYEFTYYTSYNLPGTFSCDRDHWGYYNGNNSNDFREFKLIPNKTFLSQSISGLEYNYGGAKREPHYPEMKACTLTKIKYPTGGETEFQYEPHTYYKAGSGNKIAGGLRIKRIVNYNTDESLPTFKEFTYLNENRTYSSAYFNHTFKYAYDFSSEIESPCPWPEYGCPSWVIVSGSGHAIPLQPQGEIYYSTSQNGLGLTKNSSIGYGRVQEKDGYISNGQYITKNGETEYIFTTKFESPSSYIQNEPISGWIGMVYPYGPFFKTSEFGNHDSYFPAYSYPSKDWREGLLRKKFVYNENGDPLTSIENFYSYGVNASEIGKGLRMIKLPMYYCDKMLASNILYSKYTIHSDWTRLDKTTEKTYDNGTELVVETNYAYDSQRQLLTQSTFTDSKNSTIATKYYYPFNYNTTSYNIPSLINKNIIGKPIDIRIYDGTQLRSGKQIKYNTDGQPIDVYIAEPTSTDITFNSSNPYTFSHKVNYEYNDDYRIIQATYDDSYTTAYLWDIENIYLLAKVENATYSHLSDFEREYWDTPSSSLYEDIKSDFPNALITTFTHKMLIGITQTTNPSGVSTFYNYDSFGRLSTVKNDDGKLLNVYEYHFGN